jgi:xylulokinase
MVVKRRSCVLGIDLGTSAVKVVAVSQEGRVVATARESYSTITTCEGLAEQDCGHWLNALSRAAETIRSRVVRQLRVEAIALTGQMPTLVVLDGNKPIAHAITWQDSRADRWTNERLDEDLRRDIYRRTGVIIDSRYLAPMFQFHHASKRRSADFILSAKDFLFHALTGVAATDPSTASGYGLYNLSSGSWDAELCKFWDVSVEHLPLIRSSSFSAPLNEFGSKMLGCALGTGVLLGCADSAAGVYALNSEAPSCHIATILLGLSTVIVKSDWQPQWDPQSRYLVTPLAVDGTYGREADLLASGSARVWAEAALLKPGDKKTRRSVWQDAYDVAPGADGLLFAPYLARGEQGILWNPELRGTLTGLTLAHNPAQIARALLEGMSFEIRRCLALFDEEEPISCVRVSGWMTDIPEESQMLADILGRPVHAFTMESASAVGTALLTGFIDHKKYFAKITPMVFNPSKQTRHYHEIYARYIAQFPARATAGDPRVPNLPAQ